MKNYSANEISFILGGITVDSGRGDDEFISISHPEEGFTYKKGVDGEGTRSAMTGDMALVTLTVMRTSEANAKLSALYILDKKTPGGAGVVPIMIRDRQGLSLFAGLSAWITKLPDDNYKKEADTIQWQIAVDNPEHFLGGN